MNNNFYDIIIIGGGPAGLTAGLYASRARISTLLLERIALGGQVNNSEKIENYPGFEKSISGFQLVQNLEKQAKGFGLNMTFRSGTIYNPSLFTGRRIFINYYYILIDF